MAEQAWVRIQRKTFTRWCNTYLEQRKLLITNMEQDLHDGALLHDLLECLSQEDVQPKPKRNAKLKLQKIENLNTCLTYIKAKGIKLVNVGAEDVHDQKTNLVLGLIWTLILRFQITTGESDEMRNARQALLEWCNRVLNPQGLAVRDFKGSWTDGRCFCGLVNACEPGRIPLNEVPEDQARSNMERAFKDGQDLFKIPAILDPEDVIDNPDDLSIMTYVSYYRAYLQAQTAFAANCYAEGDGLIKGVTGEEAHFTIFAVNEEGERATRGGAPFKCTLTNEAGQPECPVTVKDNLNGTYSASYTPVNAGVCTLDIKLKNDHIRDSPFHPNIEAGEPDPAQCTASGPGISQATAGVPVPFTVHSKDRRGKALVKGGAVIESVFHDPSGNVSVSVVDNQNGTYSCEYTARTTGHHPLDVIVKTKAFGTGHIQGSAFNVKVVAGEFDPTKFTWEGLELDGQGRRVVVAGETDRFRITARDKFGNQIEHGGLQFVGEWSGPHHVDVHVQDNNNGVYEFAYTPTKATQYQLHVKVNGHTVGGAPNPFPVLCIPAAAHGPNCVGTGQGLTQAVVGRDNSFSIQARDRFDNDITKGGNNVTGGLAGPASVPLVVRDGGNGTYHCTYPSLTKTGTYQLTPTVEGLPIKDAPFTLVVSAGGLNIDNTEVVWPPEQVASKDGPKVILKDDNKNVLGRGGDKVVAECLPLSVIHADATDNGDGTYDVKYPPHLRGDYRVNVKVNGKDARGGPWNAHVKEHPVSSAHQQQVQQMMPNTASIMHRLLANATDEERAAILQDLADLKATH